MFGFKLKICNPGNYRILFGASLNIDLPGREPGWLFLTYLLWWFKWQVSCGLLIFVVVIGSGLSGVFYLVL